MAFWTAPCFLRPFRKVENIRINIKNPDGFMNLKPDRQADLGSGRLSWLLIWKIGGFKMDSAHFFFIFWSLNFYQKMNLVWLSRLNEDRNSDAIYENGYRSNLAAFELYWTGFNSEKEWVANKGRWSSTGSLMLFRLRLFRFYGKRWLLSDISYQSKNETEFQWDHLISGAAQPIHFFLFTR